MTARIDYPVVLHAGFSVEITLQFAIVSGVRRGQHFNYQVRSALDVEFVDDMETFAANDDCIRLDGVTKLFWKNYVYGGNECCPYVRILKKSFQKIQ